eukprot:4309860-Pyramimonas_sp.AAC.1
MNVKLGSVPGEPSKAFVKPFWRPGGPSYSAAEALPESLPCVPAVVQARVEACRKQPDGGGACQELLHG